MTGLLRRLLRLFFQHFYHSLAWTYDAVAATVSLGRWNDWVRSALPYVEGNEVLEIGHGPGHLQRAMAGRGLHVTGIDESQQMGRQAGRRLKRSDFPARLVRGYAQSLPFPEFFDTVVSTFPSEYIVDPRTLTEVRRVLRPGGSFVVLPMAWIGGDAPPERAAAWLFRVTGESAPDAESFQERVRLPFAQAGFDVSIEMVDLRSSRLLFILARKPASP